MDIRQLKYLVEIAEKGSVSKASESLYISQSGLNQQLVRIEKELGAQVFERTTHSLTITEAGEAVLAYAREAIKKEEQMRAVVSDIIDGTTGEISINLAMEQGIEMFCAVFPEFHKAYPNISLKLEDHIVRDQYDLLMKGKLDIGMVMVSSHPEKELKYIHLADERFLLGIPKDHVLAQNYVLDESGDYPLMDLKLCMNEPFSLMFAGSTMREVIDPCFERAGYEPHILFESRTNHIVALMVENGICLTILPESQARRYSSIKWFRLQDNPSWESCLIYHRDNPPRKAGSYFIQLAQEKMRLPAKQTKSLNK